MVIRHLWHRIWLTRIGLHIVLLTALIWRKYYRQFPAFVFYTAWQVLQSGTLAVIVFGHIWGRAYYQIYLAGAAVECILSFAVIYELLKIIVRDYPVLSGVGSSLYRWTALLLILVGLTLAWYVPATGPGKVMATFSLLRRTVRLGQCGLLAFLFLFARSFGLSWRSRAFGIALGFGVSAAVSLTTSAIKVRIIPEGWTRTHDILTLIDQLGDLTGVLIWLAYLLPKHIKGPPPPSSPLPVKDMESWNREIQRLLP